MRSSLAGLITVTLLCCQTNAAPQQGTPALLGDILARLQTNLREYRATIPNFFCEEHLVSRSRTPDNVEDKTVTDSIYRLNHRDPLLKDLRLNLVESRELRSVNDVPTHSDNLLMQTPMMVIGIFSNATSVISQEMEHCYNYTPGRNGSFDGHPAIEIAFSYKEDKAADPSCVPVLSSGNAIFDATTFHPFRFEMTVPHTEVFPRSRKLALWRWRVDFKPVTFDDRQFWLPAHISSRLDADDQTTTWYYAADYTNYHKLTVKSRIITDTDAP